MRLLLVLAFGFTVVSCTNPEVGAKKQQQHLHRQGGDLVLDYETAVRLSALPLDCYNKEYPHKYGLSFNGTAELKPPSSIHPIFYGCFDWHSAVHGHWMLASLLNKFPSTPLADTVVALFDKQFQPALVAGEMGIFSQNGNKEFERTYGWAWLLKLQEELLRNPLSEQKGWTRALQPLVDKLVESYKTFLPALVYPIRAGMHTNTAFGLIFALEYAQIVNESALISLIAHNCSGFFAADRACPLQPWEPSGNDFLSPCLQEADLMGRVAHSPPDISADDYNVWLKAFLPELFDSEFHLQPGHVIDRSDGLLVHLDGVNFSRAWNLYSLVTKLASNEESTKQRLFDLGDEHVRASYDYVVGSEYAGSHWLATFLVYALQMREEALASISRTKPF